MADLIDIPNEGRKADVIDDATLVVLTLQHVPKAFGEIVKRYQCAVFGMAL